MHKCVQHEVSKTIYVDSIPNQKKIIKVVSTKNICQDDYTFDAYIGGKVHICTKYEVSIFNPVARRGVHNRQRRTTRTTPDDGQSMTVLSSLVDKSNEPKTQMLYCIRSYTNIDFLVK